MMVISIQEKLKKRYKKHGLFSDDEQHDASEALTCILQTLSEGGANINSIKVSSTITIECSHCSRRSETTETLFQIPLCCDNRSKSINSCLREYSSATTISDYICENMGCDRLGGCHTISITNEPEVLLIIIQRLEYERRSLVGFECPMNGLHIPGGNASYQLIGAVLHKGMSRDSGHYQCLIRKGHMFYHCNDKEVKLIDIVSAKELLSANVCMLIYRRMRSWR